jgi:hypothetical protein
LDEVIALKLVSCDVVDAPDLVLVVRVVGLVEIHDLALGRSHRFFSIDPDDVDLLRNQGRPVSLRPLKVGFELVGWVEHCQFFHGHAVLNEVIYIVGHRVALDLEGVSVEILRRYFLPLLYFYGKVRMKDDSIGYIEYMRVEFDEPFDPLVMWNLSRIMNDGIVSDHEEKLL